MIKLFSFSLAMLAATFAGKLFAQELPGGKTAQTDIAAFNIKASITTMVNNTPESEYSPTPIPGRNALSVIQVEADQNSGANCLWCQLA